MFLYNYFLGRLNELPKGTKAGDDTIYYKWFRTNDLPDMAFDHKKILKRLLLYLFIMQPNEVNQDNQNTNSLLEMLEKLKPMASDFMNQLQTKVNEKQVDLNTPCDTSSDTSGTESNDNDSENKEENQENKENQDPLKNAMSQAFGMLSSMFKDLNKYKDRQYLAYMPNIFLALSKTTETSESSSIVKNSSAKINDMLKEKNIDELCNDDLFKECVFNVSFHFQKMAIDAVKIQLNKLEDELVSLEQSSVDHQLNNIYEKFVPKGK